jgi:hypothetical protein
MIIFSFSVNESPEECCDIGVGVLYPSSLSSSDSLDVSCSLLTPSDVSLEIIGPFFTCRIMSVSVCNQ